MSNHHRIPQEVRDHIVDHLHDDPETLKRCSLVSKSWVSRTQKHLFSSVTFKSVDYSKWRKAFPDPMNSPARHARTLTVDGAMGSAEEIRWIQSFSRVERLVVDYTWAKYCSDTAFLAPFCKLAPSLKSLSVHSIIFPHSQIFNLICSLPLLEDLAVTTCTLNDSSGDKLPTLAPSPALTGTLELSVSIGMGIVLQLLQGLQGGLHFRGLQLLCCQAQDLASVEELVVACSDTLECLDIGCEIYGPKLGPINLSKATKLEDIVFRCDTLSCGWIATTLRTITPEHRSLQQISIYLPFIGHYHDHSVVNVFRGGLRLQWSDLDRLLVEFWELRSVGSKVVCPPTKHWARLFVPQLTERGIFDPADVDEPHEPGRGGTQ